MVVGCRTLVLFRDFEVHVCCACDCFFLILMCSIYPCIGDLALRLLVHEVHARADERRVGLTHCLPLTMSVHEANPIPLYRAL